MTDPRKKLQLGVLVSGSGTNLQAILDAAGQDRIDVEVRVVISNRPRARGLERARAAGVPTVVVSHKKFDGREPFEEALIAALGEHGVEWVALAGFMRVLTPRFLRAFPERVINIHPALLPAFPGTHGQRQALEYGVKVSGCTIHFVDEGTDTGPIIAQAVVPVLDDDDEETLAARILEQEHRIYPWVLQLLAEGRVVRDGRRVKVMDARPEIFAHINPPPHERP
jgi:phosphoribosylglycinamide formyltransferase-1